MLCGKCMWHISQKHSCPLWKMLSVPQFEWKNINVSWQWVTETIPKEDILALYYLCSIMFCHTEQCSEKDTSRVFLLVTDDRPTSFPPCMDDGWHAHARRTGTDRGVAQSKITLSRGVFIRTSRNGNRPSWSWSVNKSARVRPICYYYKSASAGPIQFGLF